MIYQRKRNKIKKKKFRVYISFQFYNSLYDIFSIEFNNGSLQFRFYFFSV